MTRRVPKAAVQLPLARIEGQRWCVAMCDTEWAAFTDVIDLAAQCRLLAILDYFCDHGEANLPPGAFRWLTSDAYPSRVARQGAFEARGIILTGRAAMSGHKQTFFVTAIETDTPENPPRRRPRGADPRQGLLPLQFSKPERN